VDFILGDDFFQGWDLEFDYAKGVVRLFQPRNCKDGSARVLGPKCPVRAHGGRAEVVLPVA
jgi:hypothetical protein